MPVREQEHGKVRLRASLSPPPPPRLPLALGRNVCLAAEICEDSAPLYLSFSLMSYHVPQRYLGALIAAVNEQRRLFPEGSKNPRSDDVTVAQFAVRFEHVGV